MQRIFLHFFTRLRQICKYALIENQFKQTETLSFINLFYCIYFSRNEKRSNIGKKKNKLEIFSYAQLAFNTRRWMEEKKIYAMHRSERA